MSKPIVQNTFFNDMEFIHIPAGKFLMGDKDEKHTVDIPYEYWMARFPVTNEQYSIYAKAKRIDHPVEGWGEKKDHPVYKVTWYETMEYCAWLNNLLKAELPSGMMVCLPTEAEWEKAARGTDGRAYPWGDTFDKNKCNSEESKKYGTTPVALFSPQGDSPYGCSDMAGNVSEWTHSISKGYPYNPKDGREDEKSNFTCAIRGGAYFLHARFLLCASNSLPQYPDSRNGSSGFRIAICSNISR
jgi:formylglycine-generating enzyme required for sulfatase activity